MILSIFNSVNIKWNNCNVELFQVVEESFMLMKDVYIAPTFLINIPTTLNVNGKYNVIQVTA